MPREAARGIAVRSCELGARDGYLTSGDGRGALADLPNVANESEAAGAGANCPSGQRMSRSIPARRTTSGPTSDFGVRL